MTHISHAEVEEAPEAIQILREVSEWLIASGKALWDPDEISDGDVARSANAGELIIAREGGEAIACMYLQKSDPIFWPDAAEDEASYVHRLAVRRAYAGQGRARQMLDWAAAEARRMGRLFIRLDTELRPHLLTVYESAGFRRVDPKAILLGGHEVVRFERRV